jgi:hypothetical protein
MKCRQRVSFCTARFSAKYSENDLGETSMNKVMRIFSQKQNKVTAQHR